MVDWQVTAATLYCDAVDEEVTVMVYKDWSVKCTGHQKYFAPSKEAARQLRKKSEQLQRAVGCEGLECRQVVCYKEKLLAEEARKSGSS